MPYACSVTRLHWLVDNGILFHFTFLDAICLLCDETSLIGCNGILFHFTLLMPYACSVTRLHWLVVTEYSFTLLFLMPYACSVTRLHWLVITEYSFTLLSWCNMPALWRDFIYWLERNTLSPYSLDAICLLCDETSLIGCNGILFHLTLLMPYACSVTRLHWLVVTEYSFTLLSWCHMPALWRDFIDWL